MILFMLKKIDSGKINLKEFDHLFCFMNFKIVAQQFFRVFLGFQVKHRKTVYSVYFIIFFFTILHKKQGFENNLELFFFCLILQFDMYHHMFSNKLNL